VLRVAPTEGLAAPHAPELVEEAHLTSRHFVHLEGGHGLLLLLVRLELVVVDRGNGGPPLALSRGRSSHARLHNVL
jgi:hypothetical protein